MTTQGLGDLGSASGGYPGAGRPGSATGATVEGLQREVDRLQQHVTTLRQSATAGRWILGITTLIVILQFAIFAWAMYHKLSLNFSHENVQAAVSQRGNEVLPMAQQLVMDTTRDSLPAYRDAFLSAIHTRGPGLAKAAEDRFEQVPAKSGAMLQDKLQTVFTNVMQKIEPDFKTAFPNLSDEKRQQMVQAFLADQIDTQNKRIADHISQLGTNDLIKVQAALESFDLPAADDKSIHDDQLEHSVLHSMVMLLDDQLDATYGKITPDDSAMPAGMRPSTVPTTQPMGMMPHPGMPGMPPGMPMAMPPQAVAAIARAEAAATQASNRVDGAGMGGSIMNAPTTQQAMATTQPTAMASTQPTTQAAPMP